MHRSGGFWLKKQQQQKKLIWPPSQFWLFGKRPLSTYALLLELEWAHKLANVCDNEHCNFISSAFYTFLFTCLVNLVPSELSPYSLKYRETTAPS